MIDHLGKYAYVTDWSSPVVYILDVDPNSDTYNTCVGTIMNVTATRGLRGLDINADDNPFNNQPALCPMRGCVRELVASANEIGFFWGGHFSSPKDGMHFEFADFEPAVA